MAFFWRRIVHPRPDDGHPHLPLPLPIGIPATPLMHFPYARWRWKTLEIQGIFSNASILQCLGIFQVETFPNLNNRTDIETLPCWTTHLGVEEDTKPSYTPDIQPYRYKNQLVSLSHSLSSSFLLHSIADSELAYIICIEMKFCLSLFWRHTFDSDKKLKIRGKIVHH